MNELWSDAMIDALTVTWGPSQREYVPVEKVYRIRDEYEAGFAMFDRYYSERDKLKARIVELEEQLAALQKMVQARPHD